MEIISYALSSVIWLLEYIYTNLVLMLASSGVAIIGVGFISYLIMYPIHRLGLKIERQINVRIQAVNNDLSKLDHSLKGEKLFEKKEEIFNKHGYTPFQNIGLAMGFIFLLPLLLSAIALFTTTDLVVEKAFFSIPDLGKMDGLLFGINFYLY